MAAHDSRVLYAGRHLLDHQIVGIHGEMIGKVEDLEIDPGAPGTLPTITAVLTGQIPYGQRLGGTLGRWIRSSAQRLRGTAGPAPYRIDIALVRSIGHTVTVNVPAAELPTPDLEAWLADHVIGPIPGSGR